MNRRNFCKTTLSVATSIAAASSLLSLSPLSGAKNNIAQWYMPDEGELHTRTWMCLVANEEIWSQRQIPEVKRNLILIAKTIAQYEPVSMLVRPQDYDFAIEQFRHLKTTHPITLIAFTMDDLWVRDTGPTFVLDYIGNKAAVDFNFNGWGEKQAYTYDKEVAGFIAEEANTALLTSSLTLEGGCFEVDGYGTAIMTESCILNDNRNPGKSKTEIESKLKQQLGLRKIIWLKGIKGKDITDGHTDFYARFAKPGVVVVSRDNDPDSFDYKITRENINTLTHATDAQGKPLRLVILDTPTRINTRYGEQDFAAGYVGYYLCNKGLIMQKFGDKQADAKAREQLQALFPDRSIQQIAIDGIASGGGSIHCATQQEPAPQKIMAT